jgi:hypothetical protein
MPISNDNQDYKNDENLKDKGGDSKGPAGENKGQKNKGMGDENELTSDNLKGKKVDADLERETDKPADV